MNIGDERRHNGKRQRFLHCPNCGQDRWVGCDRFTPSHNKACRCIRKDLVLSEKGAEIYMKHKGYLGHDEGA